MPATRPVADPLVLAFDVGGTSVKAAAVDGRLTTLVEVRLPSPKGPAVLETVMACADDLLDRLGEDLRGRVAAAGVAMLGLVDVEKGICLQSVNLGLRDLDISAPLSARLGIPVRLGHDVRAAGVAEQRLGFADVADPFVVIIGTGIAAVTFVRGQPVDGVTGQAGEFGHVVVRPNGPACACGARGCLEAVSSARAIAQRYEELSGSRVEGALDVVHRLETDPIAEQVWTEATSALADGLAGVCALLAPGAIVLGGGLAQAGDHLTGRVSGYLAERLRVTAVPPVHQASLGSRAGLIGAALLAQDMLEAR